MTQEEILEYNKRCSKFLGQISQPFKFPQFEYIKSDGDYSDIFFDNQLKFHTDWNWIIEVVEAIEKLGYQFDITDNEVGINSNIMSMENISTGGTMNSYNRSYYPTIISVCEEEYSKKEAVVQAINQFLIWYNENK